MSKKILIIKPTESFDERWLAFCSVVKELSPEELVFIKECVDTYHNPNDSFEAGILKKLNEVK